MSTVLSTQDGRFDAQLKLNLNCNLVHFNPSGPSSGGSGDIEVH